MERQRVSSAARVVFLLLALTVSMPALAADPNPTPSAASDPTEVRLSTATQLFDIQQYDKVVALLQPILPKVKSGALIKEPFQRYKYYELLGVSMWWQDQKDAARRVFTELLKANSSHRLPAVKYPEDLIRFFENHKADLISYGVLGAGGSSVKGPRQIKVRETRINTTPTIAYVLPFGVGQFANGEDTKGAIVITLQIIGLAGSIGAYWGHRAIIGEDPNQKGSVQPGAQEITNEALIGISIGSLAVFGAAYIYGLIDGFANRPATETTTERTEVEDPDNDAKKSPREAQPSATLRISPAAAGFGVGLSGTF